MTVNVTVIGGKELIARFSSMPRRVHDELFKSVTKLSLQLENYIKTNKLSGQVLNKISGRLQSSIHSRVSDTGTKITGSAFSAAPMPYAAIHEYGGTIPAHEIFAKNAQALRFMIGGKIVFAKSVQIPDVKMPERSFMRSALADKRVAIIQELTAAVTRGTAAK